MAVSVQFTRAGRPTGDPSRATDANDVHFRFRRGTEAPKIRYTVDGSAQPGGEHAAPEGAHDVGVEWATEDGSLVLRDSHWTDAEGKAIGGPKGYIAPPAGANDWHLDLGDGVITEAWWTKNGQKYTPHQTLDVPVDATDAHLGARAGKPSAVRGGPGERAALAALIGYLLGSSGEDFDLSELLRIPR